MKIKKHTYPPLFIGSSFMLVIFIVLCMVIFAFLSFSSAQRDYEYSLKNAERTTKYYQANNLAEQKLAELVTNTKPTVAEIHSYVVPISEHEQLEVTLELNPNKTPCCQILRWKQTSTQEWNGNQSLPLLGTD